MKLGETHMFREAAQAPGLIRAQLPLNEPLLRHLAARLRKSPPRVVSTLGRGSSDNAATFARYLIETRLGVMTASAPPSVSSVYDAAPAMEGALCLAISQSGRSPDLLAAARASADAGALVVALVNAPDSPLAALAHVAIPLRAGTETSVAATKTFIATLAAVVQLVAWWSEDESLLNAVRELPRLLDHAWALDWSAALAPLGEAEHLYTVGRGLGFGVAQEAALKFKETCGLHAEAFSTAEIRHGPMALVGPSFPVLAFSQDDETSLGVESAVAALAGQGAQVFKAGGRDVAGVVRLPVARGHAAIEPIGQIQTFYRMVEHLARRRGFDPDRPSHLAKITETT